MPDRTPPMPLDPIEDVLRVHEDRLAELLGVLRDAETPVVLYGAGATARRVYACLREHDVPLHAVAVDGTPEVGARFGDHPLVALADLAALGHRCHFVLGFVPVAEDVPAIAARLARLVPGRLSALDFSGLSFGVASSEFVQTRAAALRQVFEWLGDDLSRRTLAGYLKARLSFDPVWLRDLYRGNQYFPPELIRLGDRETLVDAGAYDGDTITQFVERTDRRYAEIWAFEPDPDNFAKLGRTVTALGLNNCHLRNSGTWEHDGELAFRSADARLSGLDREGDVTVRVEAIDSALEGAPVSLIKMDVEGAELPSLKGAERSIRRHRPRLAICLYHQLEDLVTIPAWVRSALPEARLFLRVHTRFSQELVLYAIP